MILEIKLEKLIKNASEAKVTKVHKNNGDEVKPGEILFDVEVNKSSMSIKCEAVGIIQSIKTEEGKVVRIGEVLAIVEGEKVEPEKSKTSGVEPQGGFNYFSDLLKPKKQDVECDITIIGGGPGGYVAAIQAAKLGARVVLVEKDMVGGTCLNWGCIPTKALVRSAEVFDNLKNAEEFGCFAENISIDIKKVISRKNRIVNQLVQGIEYLLDKHNVKVVKGIGEIQDEETVYVKSGMQETIIKSKYIIIAAGSKISKLPIAGLDLDVINSNQALELEELPGRMVVIGGGVIGMEFAFILSSFGVDVSVVEYLDDVLAGFDQDICTEIRSIAESKGIKVYTGSKVEEVMKTEDSQCIVSFKKGEKMKYISTDKVLVAVGREPALDSMGIENVRIELNDNGKGIKVNEQMQTNIPNIYAIGDVTNKILLAHVASHQGIVAVKNIMGESCTMDYSAVPNAIFTHPEIAMVGMSEEGARKEGLDIEVGKFPFAANGKALTMGETKGFIKLIKDKGTEKIIGGAIIGPHATDLIAEVTLAIKNGLTADQIIETIHAHPTTTEVVHEAALATEGGALHFVE